MTQSYEAIFENNRKWIEFKLSQDPDFFGQLAKTQNPEYLYIGGSDSRVVAEEITGVSSGQFFIHRTIGNVVHTLDMNSTAVIQYAVEHLKVKHIVVCGHYQCDGVKAAMTSQDLGLLNPWLRNIRDVYRLHLMELDAIADEGKRYDRLVELNVLEQCINVTKMACVQERYLLEEYPIVHGWVFDLRTGKIIDLKIDFEKILKDIQKIYNLTDSNWIMNRKAK
ncbi:carbonic anhydrase [Chryseobacterium populi]|uniref:Carbonic anhydrase 2 n=1 Tax=Chryseobacterium populi TaxID=1144316 RepID=J2T2E8_9FLAO|nr:carbonic anhydrase [Chryseobacterium populi]EJL72162.1 carbonic anhydrase [Chryseobacterium populi]